MRRPSYSAVMSTIAVFVALSGTSYAAVKLSAHSVGTRELKNSAVTTAKLHAKAVVGAAVADDALTGGQIKESTLRTVPTADRAGDADHLGGATPESYHVQCPSGMLEVGALCVEFAARPATDWKTAVQTCGLAFRRLPGPGELALAYNALDSLQSVEWTAVAAYDGSGFVGTVLGQTSSRTITLGGLGITLTTGYRCVLTPTN